MVQLSLESSKLLRMDTCPKQTMEDQQRCFFLMQRNNTKRFAWMLRITSSTQHIHEYNVCGESADTTMKS